MLRDGAPRALLLVTVGVAGFVIGVYAGLGASIAVWGLGSAGEITFLTLTVGLGAAVSCLGVILASGRASAVWRMVASRAALLAGLSIVALLTWDLGTASLIPTGVGIVGIEIWSSHLAAEYRGLSSPVTAGD